MKFTRREYIKANAAVAAAAAAQISLPAQATPYVATEDTQLNWNKAPCRFCGTGCSVMVATKGQQGCSNSRRCKSRGQPRVELCQRLLSIQDHVRR